MGLARPGAQQDVILGRLRRAAAGCRMVLDVIALSTVT
jgi:hypothetical protein